MEDLAIGNLCGTEALLADVITKIEELAPRAGSRASRSARERLTAVQRVFARRTIEAYDPDDKDGFALVMTELAAHVPDSSALAELFGISVSTLYRWKSGESVPQKLVRGAVKDHLFHLLAKEPASGDDERVRDGPL